MKQQDFSNHMKALPNYLFNSDIKKESTSQLQWKEVQKYDENKNDNSLNNRTWPISRHGHKMVVLANRFIILFGGALDESILDNSIMVYDTCNKLFISNLFNLDNRPFWHTFFGCFKNILACCILNFKCLK